MKSSLFFTALFKNVFSYIRNVFSYISEIKSEDIYSSQGYFLKKYIIIHLYRCNVVNIDWLLESR